MKGEPMSGNDICKTSSADLREIADELKCDAKALFAAGSKDEAMRLFQLFMRVTQELHRRRNPENVAMYN